ncbi:hypothetical protein [Nitrosococcus watsonii]|uniref:Uncharacterized protein n=1 Tax=Nitrosococcus watsoni (strain C-113) TaxID=105559 RepID=D8KCB1_NITWC|nr:hypothetical protein [Nitrosococcus watsonii]ADJ29782.1 conserved hypothetical protein [Nitrosococcus watsonii C-113]
MKTVMKQLLQSTPFLMATIFFCIPYAWAQEENPVQEPMLGIPCVTKAKGYVVHFTAYQRAEKGGKEEEGKKKLEFERFCHNLPITGTTLITIDLVDHYTRSRPVALRIVETASGEEQGTVTETRTLVELPEKNYRAGLLETQVDFNKRGVYAAVLTIGGEEISIPIRVGIKEEASLARRLLPIIFGILILAALGYAFYRYRSTKGKKAEMKAKKETEEK